MNYKIAFSLTIIALLIFTSACSSLGLEDISGSLSIHPTVGTEPLVYNKIYTINNKKMNISSFKYYATNIFVESTSDEKSGTSNYVTLIEGITTFSIGTIPGLHIKSANFTIGLDSTTNHTNATSYPDSNPLSITQEMWWNQTDGYVFLALIGKVDNDGDGTPETDFSYKIGGDQLKKSISISYTKDLENKIKDNISVCAELNVAKLLQNIDFGTELLTSPTENPALASKIATNLTTAFSPSICP